MVQGAAKPRDQRPTREEMLARARALVPALRERAARAEELRRLPDETEADFHATGLFRMVQPARVGGAELDYRLLLDAASEIARACASSAWNLANLASHHWMLALFPEAAQNEIWGESPDHLIASALIFPAGRARRVTGGYRLSGRWPFSSGVDNSAWNMLGGTIVHGDGTPELRIFLVPRADYHILDTWYAMGLAATGSKDVKADDVFVPEHRTLAIEDLKNGTPPGLEINPAPLYKLPVFPLFPFILSGVALGIAEGAYESHLNALKSRVATYSGAKVGDFQSVQIKTAEAAALIDTAGILMRNVCDHAAAMAAASQQPDALTKARYRRDGAFSVSLCVRAVDLIFGLAGGSGIYARNPMQQTFRDAHAVASHIVFNFDAMGITYTRAALGLPLDNPTL